MLKEKKFPCEFVSKFKKTKTAHPEKTQRCGTSLASSASGASVTFPLENHGKLVPTIESKRLKTTILYFCILDLESVFD
jgi:hypothetical protein